MKYLHLMNDEKFTDFSISLFEKCNPNNNTYIIGRFSKEPKFKVYESKNIKNFISGSKEYYQYINECNFDILVVHFLDYNKCRVINNLKSKKVIVWLAWGGDIYNTNFYKFPLYQPYTLEVLKSINIDYKTRIKIFIRKVYHFLFIKKSPSISYKNAVKKIDYCATVIPNEFEIFTGWKFFKAKQLFFSYGSIEHEFKDASSFNSLGNGILIGNSISPTSNHLDVFYKLKDLDFSTRKIIVPLNYGSEIKYKDKVVEEGQRIFGENWWPLLNFIPKSEYIKTMAKCNVAIMNHNRQQAVGNLILLFWLGCKIFLSERSTTYEYFKSKGFCVYSFHNDLNSDSLNTKLSSEDIKKNRELLIQEYGDDKVTQRAIDLINILNQTSNSALYF